MTRFRNIIRISFLSKRNSKQKTVAHPHRDLQAELIHQFVLELNVVLSNTLKCPRSIVIRLCHGVE